MGWIEESLLPRVLKELQRFKAADRELIGEVALACGRDLEEEARQFEAQAQAADDREALEKSATRAT